MNLIEGLHEQMDRARELQKFYERIPGGSLGAQTIEATIRRAESSIASGDAVDMLDAYNELEALE